MGGEEKFKKKERKKKKHVENVQCNEKRAHQNFVPKPLQQRERKKAAHTAREE